MKGSVTFHRGTISSGTEVRFDLPAHAVPLSNAIIVHIMMMAMAHTALQRSYFRVGSHQLTFPPPPESMPPARAHGRHVLPKLSQEDLTKSLQRLYDAPQEKRKKKHAQDDEEIVFNRERNRVKHRKNKEPTGQDNEIANRMYTQPLEKKKNLTAKLEQRHHSPLRARKELTPDQTDDVTQRLYNQAIEHKKRLQESCVKKAYGEGQQPKVLDKDRLAESVDNLYQKAIDKKKDKISTLETKFTNEYSWKAEQPGLPLELPPLSPDKASKMADRMHSGERPEMLARNAEGASAAEERWWAGGGGK